MTDFDDPGEVEGEVIAEEDEDVGGEVVSFPSCLTQWRPISCHRSTAT